MKIGITGPPGVGKTTLITKIYEELTSLGVKVVGFITREVRDANGKRVGFHIIDLVDGERKILAWAGLRGPRVGKYGVNVVNLEDIVKKTINRLQNCDLVIVDEIGPMELKSTLFEKFVRDLLNSKDYNVLFSIHRSLWETYKKKYDFEIYFLSRANFEKIYTDILSKIKEKIL